MCQAEFGHALPVQLVEQLELAGELVGLLPLGGELGAFLVVVVVRQVFARVGVPAEGPEAVEVDLVAHGVSQRVHEDSSAEAFGGEVLSLPVSVGEKSKLVSWTKEEIVDDAIAIASDLKLSNNIEQPILCFFNRLIVKKLGYTSFL